MTKNANPTCDVCRTALVWCGLGPAAEPFCPREATHAAPDACSRCGSTSVEPFTRWGYWTPLTDSAATAMHCVSCGHVWDAG